jgi:hypothetical protein
MSLIEQKYFRAMRFAVTVINQKPDVNQVSEFAPLLFSQYGTA